MIKTLSNGIRIVAEHLPQFSSVSVGIWVKTGSTSETPHENGLSHFIEHMMFKGTQQRSAPADRRRDRPHRRADQRVYR